MRKGFFAKDRDATQLKFNTFVLTPEDNVVGMYEGDIYLYKPSVHEYSLVAKPEGTLQIGNYTASGNWVIWAEGGAYPSGKDWKLLATNLYSGRVITLAQQEPWSMWPLPLFTPNDFSISGNTVVWVEFQKQGGTSQAVCLSEDLETGKRMRLFDVQADSPLDGIGGVSLYQNKLAWARYHVDWKIHEDIGTIYIYNILDGHQERITGPGLIYSPMIYANKIVWYQKSLNSQGVICSENVFLYNLDTKILQQITHLPLPKQETGYATNDSIGPSGIGLSFNGAFEHEKAYLYSFAKGALVPIFPAGQTQSHSNFTITGTKVGNHLVGWVEQWATPNSHTAPDVRTWISSIN